MLSKLSKLRNIFNSLCWCLIKIIIITAQLQNINTQKTHYGIMYNIILYSIVNIIL